MSPEETTTNPPPPVPAESAPSTAPEAVPSEPVATPADPTIPVPAAEPAEPITPAAPIMAPTPPPPAQPPPDPLLSKGGGTDVRSLLAKAKAKIQFRKAAKLEKIMARAREKGSIGNDEVQALLRVSDATATRYLAALVKTGRLRATGRTSGRRYQPVP